MLSWNKSNSSLTQKGISICSFADFWSRLFESLTVRIAQHKSFSAGRAIAAIFTVLLTVHVIDVPHRFVRRDGVTRARLSAEVSMRYGRLLIGLA